MRRPLPDLLLCPCRGAEASRPGRTVAAAQRWPSSSSQVGAALVGLGKGWRGRGQQGAPLRLLAPQRGPVLERGGGVARLGPEPEWSVDIVMGSTTEWERRCPPGSLALGRTDGGRQLDAQELASGRWVPTKNPPREALGRCLVWRGIAG
jgi:hypothetical protein